MPITIDHLSRDLNARRLAASNRREQARGLVQAVTDRATAEGRSTFTAGESRQIERLLAESESAKREIAEYDRQLAELATAAADDREVHARQSQRIPTGVASPYGGTHDGARAGLLTGIGGDRAAPSGYWTRASDSRRATLAPGQDFADHEVVAEHMARVSARERPVLETHGGIGSMIRAMSTTSGSAIVPMLWASRIIDKARNYAAVLQAGAEIVPMDSKIVQIGRLTTDPVASFRAEGSTISASDPVFDNVTLTATTMTALTVASMEFLQDAINADQVVEDAIGKSMGLMLDQACLYGGVTSGGEGISLASPPNPRGILAALLAVLSANVLGSGTNGTVQTTATPWNEVLLTIYQVKRGNEVPNAMLWPVRLHQKYASMYDTLNQPLRMPDDVAQIAKYETNQVASGFSQGTGTNMADLFVGDFTKLLVGQRLDFSVQILTERYADTGQIGILSTWRGDVQPARPGAFAVYRYLQGV